MTIPDYQTLMLSVLSASAESGEIRLADLVDRLAPKFNLTAEERAALNSSGQQTVFANRLAWAKTYLGKAGLLESTRRGYFTATERGRQVLRSNPSRIDNTYLNQFEEFQRFKEKGARAAGTQLPVSGAVEKDIVDQRETPDEIMRLAHKQIEASVAQELLDRILAAPPAFFERLIVSLLLSMGYGGSAADAGRAIGRSGDDGIDGVIDQDALGLDRVYIQAKRYALGNNIGSGAIRDFFGSLDRHKASKGLFVTTSGFSASAIQTVEHLSKRIVLIDGQQLTALMIRHDVGCRMEQAFYIKKVDEDFFEFAE